MNGWNSYGVLSTAQCLHALIFVMVDFLEGWSLKEF